MSRLGVFVVKYKLVDVTMEEAPGMFTFEIALEVANKGNANKSKTWLMNGLSQ